MKKLLLLTLLATTTLSQAQAQDTNDSADTDKRLNELTDKIADLQNDQLKRSQLKLTGYIQAQYQVAEAAGITSYAGGNFNAGTDKRFAIRRGRIKMDYSRVNDDGDIMTQGVVQIDYTQNGVVLRDAYANILEPHTKWFGLKVGAMDRPFGYEVTYSSGVRETPERGRMSQTLFPNEKDLGAQLYILPNKNSRYRFFKVEAGFYNGTGVLNADYDKFKDLITRLSIFKNNKNESIKYSGGISYFNGGHKNGTKYEYELLNSNNGNHYWSLTDTNAGNIDAKAKQIYYGADAQISIDWKIGLTTIRAEYITGIQSGTATSSATPRDVVTTNTLQRNFNGAYFYLVQNIAQSKHNIVIKYDWYDPNTSVQGSEIGATTNGTLTTTDIKYSTLGIGYTYNYDQNWKLVIYGDIIKNESTKLQGYTQDIKDNILTIRIQYKF